MPAPSGQDTIVSLTDRVRYLHRFRVVATVLALAVVTAGLIPAPAPLEALTPLLLVTIGATIVVGVESRLRQRSRATLSGALLLADAVGITWLVLQTGGTDSPARVAIVLHVVAATLLATPRSGVKLAVWYALLLMIGAEALEAALLPVDGTGAGAGVLALQAMLAATLTMLAARASERELSRSRASLAQLADFTRQVQQVDDPQQVLAAVAAEVARVVDAEHVLIVEARTGAVVVDLDGSGASGGPVDEVELLATVRSSGSPVTADRLTPADGWLADALPDVRNLFATPVPPTTEPHSILVASTNVPVGSRIEKRALDAVVRTVQYGSLTHANATLRARLDRAATTDGLTGVANRASFDDRLTRHLDRAAGDHRPVALLLIDIDHFKPFNDDFGHQVGDLVLQRVATALSDGTRPSDIVARYGGEEFAVILPATTLEQAAVVAERHRRRVHLVEAPRGVSVSIGVASSCGPATAAAELIERADQALYRAKDGGRDQVSWTQDPTAIPELLP